MIFFFKAVCFRLINSYRYNIYHVHFSCQNCFEDLIDHFKYYSNELRSSSSVDHVNLVGHVLYGTSNLTCRYSTVLIFQESELCNWFWPKSFEKVQLNHDKPVPADFLEFSSWIIIKYFENLRSGHTDFLNSHFPGGKATSSFFDFFPPCSLIFWLLFQRFSFRFRTYYNNGKWWVVSWLCLSVWSLKCRAWFFQSDGSFSRKWNWCFVCKSNHFI